MKRSSYSTHIDQTKLRFRLFKIKRLFSYVNSLETLHISEEQVHNPKNIGVAKAFDIAFNEEDGLFSVFCTIDFVHRKHIKEESTRLFGVKIEVVFKLIDFEGVVFVNRDDNSISIPDQLIVNLMSIAFSTARGLLFSLSAHTEYDHLILPLIDPKDFQEALAKTT